MFVLKEGLGTVLVDSGHFTTRNKGDAYRHFRKGKNGEGKKVANAGSHSGISARATGGKVTATEMYGILKLMRIVSVKSYHKSTTCRAQRQGGSPSQPAWAFL